MARSTTRTSTQVAVEELLRCASPVYHFRRTATRTSSCTARPSRRATRWSCGSPRATATTRSSTTPTALDLTRFPNDHMTFGKGPHTCMGSNLARLEMRILFETLLPRIADDRSRPATSSASAATSSTASSASPCASSRSRPDVTETRRPPSGSTRATSSSSRPSRAAEGVVALTPRRPRRRRAAAVDPGRPRRPHPRRRPRPAVLAVRRPGRQRAFIRSAVLRRAGVSRGGSAYVHEQLSAGSTVRVRGPRNHFPLVVGAALPASSPAASASRRCCR